MDSSTVIWVIVAIVVALVVIAAAVALWRRTSARRLEGKRERAGELREQAAATHEGIRKRQAELDATEAQARQMRAEADRKQAEAKRLEAELGDRRSTLHEHVQRRDDVLAQADEIDPDVERDADAGAEDADSTRSSGQHGG
jgi:predicted RNase H-like nuclease (RuvC/YqgF family)